MRNCSYAALRYCPLLGHNVVMEGRRTENGTELICLNKADCGYCEKGCRNLLLADMAGTAKSVPVAEAEVS